MKISIEKLKQNPNNPRVISKDKYEKLKKSINDFPEMLKLRPIVVDSNNTVLGGNMRLKALIDLGFKEVEIIKADDLSEEQKKEFLIKDNLGYGEWDFEELANNWDLQKLDEWGFDNLDLKEYLEPMEATKDDFEIPESESIQTDIVQGDLFEIGPHRLICGDSTNNDFFSKLFEGKVCDLIVTDPPYNVDYSAKNNALADFRPNKNVHIDIANDKLDNQSFYDFLKKFYDNAFVFTKLGGSIYVFHADTEGINFRSAFKDAGFKLAQCLIWLKNHMVLGRQDYQWKHEPLLYGWKEGAAHGWYSDRKQTTILEFEKPQSSKEHPTMKPVTMVSYLIENSSKIGDIVFDGFMGGVQLW